MGGLSGHCCSTWRAFPTISVEGIRKSGRGAIPKRWNCAMASRRMLGRRQGPGRVSDVSEGGGREGESGGGAKPNQGVHRHMEYGVLWGVEENL